MVSAVAPHGCIARDHTHSSRPALARIACWIDDASAQTSALA